jgi:hypothetical protein
VIPRYQRVLFWALSAAILLMALFMLHGCAQAREKFSRRVDDTPLAAPVEAPTETVHLALADDSTGALSVEDRELALPQEPTARIRALLARLFAEYAYKDSKHPLETGPAVDDVFLLDLPLKPATASARTGGRDAGGRESAAPGRPLPEPAPAQQPASSPRSNHAQLAIVNLHLAFADHHPSGIEPESLTIASILGTIHANFPRIEQVRFLVDGQPRTTLNGHADLTRVYPLGDSGAQTPPAAPEDVR